MHNIGGKREADLRAGFRLTPHSGDSSVPTMGAAPPHFYALVEVDVSPAESDLEDPVQIGERAICPDEKAPPEKRVNVSDPDIDQVCVKRIGHIHCTTIVSGQSPAVVAFVPGLKCSPKMSLTRCRSSNIFCTYTMYESITLFNLRWKSVERGKVK